MAGDWLAVRLDVARDPAVLAMSRALSIPVATVVGGCVIAWAWANEQLADGNARGVTFAHLDALTGVTGLSDAMQNVGWLRVRDSGITIPSFDRWNSKSAKKRLLGARRAASSRSQKRNAHVTQPALRKRHLEERRVEESSTTPHTPLGGPGVRAARVTSNSNGRRPRRALRDAGIRAWADVVAGLEAGRGRGAPLSARTAAAVAAAWGSAGALRDAMDRGSLGIAAARKAFLDAYVALEDASA